MAIVCPVCEHVQAQGSECEVCGKKLTTLGAVEAQVEPLADLEPTLQPVNAPGAVATMADLELTQLPGADAQVQVQPIPDVERAAQPVGAVQTEEVQELDRGRAEPVGAPTEVSTASVTCRYCKNVQAQGAICDVCGMKLPRIAEAAPQATGGADVEGPIVWHSCGVKTPSNRRCTSCGVFVPLATE